MRIYHVQLSCGCSYRQRVSNYRELFIGKQMYCQTHRGKQSVVFCPETVPVRMVDIADTDAFLAVGMIVWSTREAALHGWHVTVNKEKSTEPPVFTDVDGPFQTEEECEEAIRRSWYEAHEAARTP